MKTKKNLVLVGMMGSGKSTIGNIISKKLDFKLIDTDYEIENAEEISVKKIFEIKGVKIFCDLKSWLYVKGTTIDFSDDLLSGGFKIENPNAERTCGCGTSFSV